MRTRSRMEILNYILNFSTIKYSGKKLEGSEHVFCSIDAAFRGSHLSDQKPPIGSLCLLSCASFSKWYLSWLRGYKPDNMGGNYLLESIEDGQQIWWTNVMVYYLPLEISNKFPQWQWTDDKWEFWDKWKRACKRRGAYITIPMLPIFTEGGAVTLRTRTRFGLNDRRPEKQFDNWKKVRQKDMFEFYDYAASVK